MILGYKAPPGEDSYFFGKVDGVDKKFRRVIAGIVLPVFDRQESAVVMIAELFRVNRPQDFTVLDCSIGDWPHVEQSLLEYDKQLQFRDAIVPTKEERQLLWRIPWSTHILTWHAPKWALTEVGRQKVNELIKEGRLHLGAVEAVMGKEPELSGKALQTAVCYALDWNPPYIVKKRRPAEYRPLGTVGL